MLLPPLPLRPDDHDDHLERSAPGAEVETITVASLEDATRWSFPGSPTIRVDGIDIDPEAPTGFGLG